MTPPAYEGVVIEYEIYNVFTETVCACGDRTTGLD